jgi:ADP-ribosylation factor-like protein 5B
MGFLLSKVLDLFSSSSDNFKLVILGLQNAGKTTILYRLSLGQLVSTQPTIGSNVEEISHNNVKFQAWDLGGQESMRSVWDVYYIGTDAIIYVIDSADTCNYEESKTQLLKLLQNDELKSTVLLIFANKQDLDTVQPVDELVKIYGLDQVKNHLWHMQPCSAKTGEGLMAGLKWLSDQLLIRKNSRFPNNPYLAIPFNKMEQETRRSSTEGNLTLDNKLNFSKFSEKDVEVLDKDDK